MKSLVSFIFFVVLSTVSFSQTKGATIKVDTTHINTNKVQKLDTTKYVTNLYGARYIDYKIITHQLDTIQIDTTLTIQKEFVHNFINKDNFELLEFNNIGQTFTSLGYNFVDNDIFPDLGINAKKFGYLDTENVQYFNVPTPTTILFYKSGYEGQVVNGTFATNFNRYNNFSIGYKGLRSLGDYRSTESSHKQFRTTYSYYNPDKAYQFRAHITVQNITNQESDGIEDTDIVEFINDTPEFSNRNRLDPLLNDTKTSLRGESFYLEHDINLFKTLNALKKKVALKNYQLESIQRRNTILQNQLDTLFTTKPNDSVYAAKSDSLRRRIKDTIAFVFVDSVASLNKINFGHAINYKYEEYRLNSNDDISAVRTIYGDNFNSVTADTTRFKTFQNTFYTQFTSPYLLGNLKVFNNYYKTIQNYDNILFIDGSFIGNRKLTNFSTLGAEWNAKVDNITLKAIAEQAISSNNLSNLHVKLNLPITKDISLLGGVQIKSTQPDANKLFFQSNFENLNWNNNFKNENSQIVYGALNTKYGKITSSFNRLDNHVYFNENSLPTQFGETINYFKIKASNEFKYWKFALNNTIMYQNVIEGSNVFRVPNLVTRNTLYYTDYVFKGKPLLLQTGFTFKYFSKYKANQLNPVLNEFYIQNNTEIGDFPMVDFFVNGQVRRTRLFFKIENFTGNWTGRNYFSAPNYPYRDFTIRFGVVWNFFN